MVHLTYPDDGTDRLFLVLQPGRVIVFPNDPDVSETGAFLDITDRVHDQGNEEGLLGMAFDPDYRDKRLLLPLLYGLAAEAIDHLAFLGKR